MWLSSLLLTLISVIHRTTSVDTTDGRRCVFPFIFEGQTYNTCTDAGSDSGLLWCAVTDNYDQDGLWGYCGEETQPEFDNCPLVADVTFVIEPLGAFTDDDWYTTATFLKRFVDNLPVSSVNTRIAFLSSDMTDSFYLNKYYERPRMKGYIDGWIRPTSPDSLAGLFDFVTNSIYTRNNGDRADVKNIVIAIINGQGSEDQSDVRERAYLLQQEAMMYIIGVTQSGQFLANSLTSDKERIISADSFRDLNTIVFPKLFDALCNNQDTGGTPKPPPACSELEVSDVTPNHGSILGGTEVTITGCQLAVGSEQPVVSFGDALCTIKIGSVTPDRIVCTTGSSVGSASIVVQLKIQPSPMVAVRYSTGWYFNYAYNNEAAIHEIIPSPPKTMVSGSIGITMKGQNFPGGGVKLLLENQASVLVLESNCRTVNSSQLICLTPDLSAYIPPEVRRRRSLVENHKNIRHLLESALIKKRQKRQVQNAKLAFPGYFELFLGVDIPNNRKFTDLGRLFPRANTLQVFGDPNIFSFGGVQKFKPFAPFNQKTIKIKGERLDQGVRAEDYQIVVGTGPCKVVKLSYNELECEPPLTPDPPDAEKVRVYILVGIISFSPGEVDYDSNQWEDTGFQAGIGFFIFGFIVVVTIIWIIVACVMQRQIEKASSNTLPPPPRELLVVQKKKNKVPKKVRMQEEPDHHRGRRSPESPQSSDESESHVNTGELPESRMNTGVSVDGYERADYAY